PPGPVPRRGPAQCAIFAARSHQSERLGTAKISRQDFLSADVPGARLRADLRGRRARVDRQCALFSFRRATCDHRWQFAIDPKDAANLMPPAPKKPSFVSDADVDFFVGEFKRTGF